MRGGHVIIFIFRIQCVRGDGSYSNLVDLPLHLGSYFHHWLLSRINEEEIVD
jgi:hypothetical protein